MKLITTVEIPKTPITLAHSDQLFFIGSCFTTSIGEQFQYHGFNTMVNPFGTVYNPLAIFHQLQLIQNGTINNDLIIEGEKEICYLGASTEFQDGNKEKLIENLQNSIQETREFLSRSKLIFITFGTSSVFNYLDNTVANCHKIPANQFNREKLSVKQIIESILQSIQIIKELNADCQILLTVSPIRHQKDGMVQNARNKAKLIQAIDEIESQHFDGVFYFPSYEIVLDELRDYRFYASDLIHLNETGVNYIWNKVKKNLINENSFAAMKKVVNYQKLKNHKVTGGALALETHQDQIEIQLKNLIHTYPYLKHIT